MITATAHKNILMIGTGYVGLITAIGLAESGHTVQCYDINPERITSLKQGQPPFFEPEVPELLQQGIAREQLTFYDDLQHAYQGQRYIFVGVQTPQDANGRSDLSMLYAAITAVAERLTSPALLIIKSTVPVGVFADLSAIPAVQGKDITFVSCPEFLAEGTAVHDFFNPMRTIVGSDDQSISEEVAGLFYGLGGAYIMTDAKTAQMIKYGANSFLATRVAFINDIAEICEKVDVNVNDVATALVMDPRVGGTYLQPSVGFAGPCLPKDIAALIETSERVGTPTLLLRGALAHNEEHLRHVINLMIQGVASNATVAILGLSFKANTDDVRNSFALKIAQSLLEQGFTVRATDPHAIPAAQREISHDNLTFFDDPYQAAAGSDLQICMTPWEDYKTLDIAKMASVVRTKNIFDSMQVLPADTARSHGFVYRGVGVSDAQHTAPFVVADNPRTI